MSQTIENGASGHLVNAFVHRAPVKASALSKAWKKIRGNQDPRIQKESKLLLELDGRVCTLGVRAMAAHGPPELADDTGEGATMASNWVQIQLSNEASPLLVKADDLASSLMGISENEVLEYADKHEGDVTELIQSHQGQNFPQSPKSLDERFGLSREQAAVLESSFKQLAKLEFCRPSIEVQEEEKQTESSKEKSFKVSRRQSDTIQKGLENEVGDEGVKVVPLSIIVTKEGKPYAILSSYQAYGDRDHVKLTGEAYPDDDNVSTKHQDKDRFFIGAGAAKVAKWALDLQTREFVVKTQWQGRGANERAQWQRETDIMSKFQGIGIPTLHGVFKYDKKSRYMHHHQTRVGMMMRAYESDFARMVDKVHESGEEVHPFPNVATRKKAMCQVCAGLVRMHAENIAHLDIKTENIFVNWDPSNPEEIEAALCDFDQALELTDQNLQGANAVSAGTPDYRPPNELFTPSGTQVSVPKLNLLKGKSNHSKREMNMARDVYSLGQSFYEIYFQANTSSGDSAGRQKFLNWVSGPAPAAPLEKAIWTMVQADYKQRPTAQEALEMLQQAAIA